MNQALRSDDDPGQIGALGTLVAFVTLGTLTVTQDLAGRVLGEINAAGLVGNPDLVAEETFALVCVASARAAAFGRRGTPSEAELLDDLFRELPFTWRDYVVGGALLDDPGRNIGDEADQVYERLARKMAFYSAHLLAGSMPGPSVLREKMPLWLGRISPPGMPTIPDDRLKQDDLPERLHRHVRLVRAFAEQAT